MNDDRQMFVFSKSAVSGDDTSFVEHSHVGPDSEPWPVVMTHFAHFLESCGYVGVVERIEGAFGEYH